MKTKPVNDTRPKAVGIWIRVSTEDQVKGESPEVHEKRARMYSEAREWEVREVYRLEAVSGKSVMGHPEAKRMLADIRSGHISGLVFSKLARLARNTRELLDFADAFRAAHADMISLHEAIDTGSPAGRFFFTLLSAMAQWEREEIAERIAASVPIRAKMGRHIGGTAQFGYQWKDKRFLPDPKEAPIRALMYELFREHRRIKTVARILNERGYRTRDGGPFVAVTVKRLLTDPTAKGLLRQNYTRSQGPNKNWELKPKEEWVETPVEPIVSAELWQEVNALLENRRLKGTQPARRSPHLFAGYAFCACGGKMYVWSNSPKYVCKACRNKIPIKDLEAVYRDRLSQFVLSPEEIMGHRAAADEAISEKEALLHAAEAKLGKIETEDEQLYQLYLASGLTPPDFARRQKPLSERRRQLEDELPRLQAAVDVLKIGSASTAIAEESAADLASRWDLCSVEEKRQFVETITERITVGKEEVAISLLCLPASPHHEGNASLTLRTHVSALLRPSVPLVLSAVLPKACIPEPQTLGEHIRKRRVEAGLSQNALGRRLGVTGVALLQWEKDRTTPEARFYPALVAFLGYDPLPPAVTLSEKIKRHRLRLGLTQKQAARYIGISEETFAAWEKGVGRAPLKEKELERFFRCEPRDQPYQPG